MSHRSLNESALFYNICVDMKYLLPTPIHIISGESMYKHPRS